MEDIKEAGISTATIQDTTNPQEVEQEPIKKPRRKLSFKQRMFINKYIENGGNGTQAADDVYNTKNRVVSQAISSENLQHPLIREEIEKYLAVAGLSKDIVFTKLQKAMTKGVDEGTARLSDGLKGIDMYFKLLGLYPGQVKNVTNKTISIHLHAKNEQELLKMAEEKFAKIKERTVNSDNVV
jgi:hypothetical protein